MTKVFGREVHLTPPWESKSGGGLIFPELKIFVAIRWRHPGSAPSGLHEFDRRDWPLSDVAPDRNSQAVHLVKPNVLYRPGPSIRKDYGLAYELRPGLFKRAKDR
jgi:hypothetical protein